MNTEDNMSPENPTGFYHEYSSPPNDGGSGRGPERKEKEEFNPSWLIKNEDEFQVGLNGTLENDPKEGPTNEHILRNLHHQAQLPPEERNGLRGWEMTSRELERRANLMEDGSRKKDFLNVAVRRIEQYLAHEKGEPSTHDETGYKYRQPDERDTFYRKRKGPGGRKGGNDTPGAHNPRRDESKGIVPVDSGIMYVDESGGASYEEPHRQAAGGRGAPPPPDVPVGGPIPFDDEWRPGGAVGPLPHEDVAPRVERNTDAEEEYREYLKQEHWADSEPIKIPAKRSEWPAFFAEMTSEQKDVFRVRLEINNAAFWKRTRGGTLSGYGSLGEEGENPIDEISEADIQFLCDNMAGYLEGLRWWAKVLRDPESVKVLGTEGRMINIRQISSKDDAEAFRRKNNEAVLSSINADPRYAGLLPEQKEQMAVEAGNTSFLTFYFQNIFELHGRSQWVNNVLEVGGVDSDVLKNGYYVQPAMAEQLDRYRTALFNAFSGDGSIAANGQMGPWLLAEIQFHGIVWNKDQKDFQRIQLLPATKEAERQYWEIRGGTLSLPAFYAVNGVLGSVLDEAKINNKTIFDMLADGDDVNWNLAPGLNGRYLSKARQMQKLDEYQLGQHQFSEIAKPPGESWIGVKNKIADKFSVVKSEERTRWLAYNSSEIDIRPKTISKYRGPRIAGAFSDKAAFEGIMADNGVIDNPFHPWDGPGLPSFF